MYQGRRDPEFRLRHIEPQTGYLIVVSVIVVRGSSTREGAREHWRAGKERGVKVVTIRYYEQVRVLLPPERTEGNYRTYCREHANASASFAAAGIWVFHSMKSGPSCNGNRPMAECRIIEALSFKATNETQEPPPEKRIEGPSCAGPQQDAADRDLPRRAKL
jgi:hypothetical protein